MAASRTPDYISSDQGGFCVYVNLTTGADLIQFLLDNNICKIRCIRV